MMPLYAVSLDELAREGKSVIDAKDFGECRWTIGQIAKAIGGNPNTMRAWVQRGYLINTKRAEQSHGLATLYSTFSAFEFAIIRALNDAGVTPDLAAKAAADFVHSGDEDRMPSHGFADGVTIVAVCPSTRRAGVTRLSELEDRLPYLQAGAIEIGMHPPVVILEVSELIASIPFRLEFLP
jgi:transposase-like protein